MRDLVVVSVRDLLLLFRVGQNRIYTPYMTVYLVISLPKLPYTVLRLVVLRVIK
jgi:hypothetical protein